MKVSDNFLDNLHMDLSEVVGEECWIDVCDMNIYQSLKFKLNSEDEVKQYETLKEVLPSIIKDHNLEHEDGSKLSNEEVAEWVLNSRWDVATVVYQSILNYMFRSPLLRRS